MDSYCLERFVTAQEPMYDVALSEIRSGKKQSHYMWYIFPQLRSLGKSPMAKAYGIEGREEAEAYLRHPLLSARLLEITEALLSLATNDPVAVVGDIDAKKLRSCMTLFASLSGEDSLFHKVLQKYYNGEQDKRTLRLLARKDSQLMNLEKISVMLSYLLRHCKEPLYVDRDGGWASVDTILAALRERYPQMDRATLEEIVATDGKGRYSFDEEGMRIRANQGHSIPGVAVTMDRPVPPEYLYHGTATRFLPQILQEGLKPMTRQYVHISSDRETALKVAKRHGEPVVLLIRAREFAADGHELLCSSNGVWQAKAVPPAYFSIMETE